MVKGARLCISVNDLSSIAPISITTCKHCCHLFLLQLHYALISDPPLNALERPPLPPSLLRHHLSSAPLVRPSKGLRWHLGSSSLTVSITKSSHCSTISLMSILNIRRLQRSGSLGYEGSMWKMRTSTTRTRTNETHPHCGCSTNHTF